MTDVDVCKKKYYYMNIYICEIKNEINTKQQRKRGGLAARTITMFLVHKN